MNLFELFAKIVLDDEDYKKGVKGAQSTFSKLSSTISTGLKTAAKVGGAALAAGTTALTALTKMAIDGYADFEQVAGGAQLMFGEAYETVAKNAKEAYATVQMSQADYLRQANGFATGLKTALEGDEQAAADLAHKIIKAEADVIAATGNTQENIQNAFNGIMKSNYTMLDNLQIGITPTKEGFQEVIDKVNEWNAANGRATDYQIENLADSQAALVDYIEMVGMSGYASAEASGTISGSFASMKSAWENFVLGFSDPEQDIGVLTQNLVDSAVTVAGNVGTRISEILPRIAEGLSQLGEKLLPEITKFVEDNGPPLLKNVTKLINGLIDEVPKLLQFAIDALPSLAKAAASILGNLGNALIKVAPELFQKIRDMITDIDWKQVGNDVADGLAEIDWGQLVADFFLTLGTAFGALGAFLVGLFEDAWNALVDYFGEWISRSEAMGGDVISGLLAGILNGLVEIGAWIWKNVFVPFIDGVKDAFGIASPSKVMKEQGGFIIQGLLEGITSFLSDIVDIGADIVESIREGIEDAWESLTSWFNGIWDSLFGSRNVNVNVNQSTKKNGSHAGGLDYVPFDGYVAQLHRGEQVLTRAEAEAYRSGKTQHNTSGVTIVQNIQTVPQTPVEIAAATQAYFTQARWAF